MDPRRVLPVLVLVAVTCVAMALGVVALRPDGQSRAEPAPATTRTPSPATLLAAWDRARSDAWEDGDGPALAALYVPRSRAGAADVAMLHRWTDRGLRVTGLRTQVLALAVKAQSPRRLVLVVTDRVVGGVAVVDEDRLPLPADRASTRRVVLRRVAGRWLVGDVSDHT